MEVVLFKGVTFDWHGEFAQNWLSPEQTEKLKYCIENYKQDNPEYVRIVKKMIAESSEDDYIKHIFHIATIPNEATDYYIFTSTEAIDDENFYYDYFDELVYVIDGKIHKYYKPITYKKYKEQSDEN